MDQLPLASKNKDIPVLYPDLEIDSDHNRTPDETTRRLYEEYSGSVVQVFAGRNRGSGFFAGDKGEIVTNWHVLQHKSDHFVRTKDGALFRAELTNIDPVNDLASLKLIRNKNEKKLPKPLTLGESIKLKPNSYSAAFGHPQGRSDVYISPGKTIGRTTFFENIDEEKDAWIARGPLGEVFKAKVLKGLKRTYQGNSGGPRLDAQGKVIGVEGTRSDKYRLATPVESVSKLLSDHLAYQFEYAFRSDTSLYLNSRENLDTIDKGYPATTVFSAAASRSRSTPVRGLGLLGLSAVGLSLIDSDLDRLMNRSTTSLDYAVNGANLTADTAIVGGVGQRLLLPGRAGKIGLAVALGGLATRFASSLIPYRWSLDRITKDGKTIEHPPARHWK